MLPQRNEAAYVQEKGMPSDKVSDGNSVFRLPLKAHGQPENRRKKAKSAEGWGLGFFRLPETWSGKQPSCQCAVGLNADFAHLCLPRTDINTHFFQPFGREPLHLVVYQIQIQFAR